MLKQSLQQRLLQKLSPQQIQLMKLLQLPVVSLEARIKEELEENPALEDNSEEDWEEESEVDDIQQEEDSFEDFNFDDYLEDGDDGPDYNSYTNNNPEPQEREIPFAQSRSFQDLLKSQLDLCVLSDHEHKIAENIIGNLDDTGYLQRELSAMIDDLAFSQNIETTEEELLTVLHVIQSLDPPGIGARHLQECLILQLDRKTTKTEAVKIAKLVLQKQFEEFTRKHYDKIILKLGLSEQQLRSAIDEILKLNPKPGNALTESVRQTEQIIPDFMVTAIDGKLDITLNSRNIPELRLNKKYSELFETVLSKKEKINSEDQQAILFVKQKLESAKWFIDALKQRQQTLRLTIDAIVHHQRDYFLTGDETKLKPMILKDVSEKVGLDISTISRVVNSKYVQTSYGTFLLKTFFSESITSNEEGEEVSAREIKQLISSIIDDEDKRHPITDEHLTEKVNQKGYALARRTIAKYREQLNIPVARLRKQL